MYPFQSFHVRVLDFCPGAQLRDSPSLLTARTSCPLATLSNHQAIKNRQVWPFKSEAMIRIQFISTVRGAAPTDGIELIRKRLPSGETAYWNSTIRGAMIRV